MKKLLLLLWVTLSLGVVAQQNPLPTPLPQKAYVAGQNGNVVAIYDCNEKAVYYIPGYLQDIGLTDKGGLYTLVCNNPSGWGNYYVYSGFNTTKPYMAFEEDADGIYSSMAMRVKGNEVVVAGVQSRGFNDKGYESHMFGFVDGRRAFVTEHARMSLKRDLFRGYRKWTGSGANAHLVGYGQENNSGNPQGDHLSCVFHVDGVDYVDGYIYTSGWIEREYSEGPAGFKKHYLVRRCPAAWRNGHEIVKNYEQKTGAAWNINVLKYGKSEVIMTSGHKGSRAWSWNLHFDLIQDGDKNMTSGTLYPGIFREEAFVLPLSLWKANSFTHCRIYMARAVDGVSRLYGRFQSGINVPEGWFNLEAEDMTVTHNGDNYSLFFLTRAGKAMNIWWWGSIRCNDKGEFEWSQNSLVYSDIPAAFKDYKNLRVLVKYTR